MMLFVVCDLPAGFFYSIKSTIVSTLVLGLLLLLLFKKKLMPWLQKEKEWLEEEEWKKKIRYRK